MNQQNPSVWYSEVILHEGSSDIIKAEDYNVLEALQSAIRAKKGVSDYTPSPIEFFSCIMSMLSENVDHHRALLYLLQLVLPEVAENVKRLKCSDCLEILMNITQTVSGVMEPSAVRSLISCIGQILMAQELNSDLWVSSSVKKAFSMLLTFTMHDSGKVRRYAQDELQEIMEFHYNNGFIITSQYVIRQLEILCKSFNADDYHDVINYLIFIARVCPYIRNDLYINLFSLLLQISQHQCPLAGYRSLRPIEILIDSNCLIPNEIINSTFSQLLAQPALSNDNDKDASEYAIVLCLCVRHMMKQGQPDSIQQFITVLQGVIGYFLSPNAQLHKSISLFLISFFPTLSSIVLFTHPHHSQDFPAEVALNILQLFQGTLQFKYQHAWTYILPVISAVVKLFGPSYREMVVPILQQLVGIYDSSVRGDASFRLILSKTLGLCLESVGAELFFNSLNLDEQSFPVEEHFYLFDLLIEHCKHTHSSLSFFFERIIPVARAAHQIAVSAADTFKRRRYDSFVVDLWSLFTSFCVCCDDVEEAIPKYMSNIIAALNDKNYKDLSVVVCKGLTLLVRSNQMVLERQNTMGEEEESEEEESDDDDDDEDEAKEKKWNQEEFEELLPFLDILKTTRASPIEPEQAQRNLQFLSQYCEQFLLTLLPLYEQSHGNYEPELPRFTGIGEGGDATSVQVIRSTIETIFSTAPADITSKMLNQVLSKLLTAFTNENPAEAERCAGQSIILSGLLSTLIKYVKDEEVFIILRCIRPHLNDENIPILQKRVYFCLVCICKYHAAYLLTQHLDELQNIFTESVLSLNVMSKKYRMRCLYYISNSLSVSTDKEALFVLNCIPEVVLCMKDASKKIRSICIHILIRFGELFNASATSYTLMDGSQHTTSFAEFIQALMNCLMTENTHMQSSAILSISYVINHFRTTQDMRDVELTVLHMCYTLIGLSDRERCKSCLRLIKMAAKYMNDNDLNVELNSIVQSVMVNIKDNKNRFRAKIKIIIEILLKRVGEDRMKELVPAEDQTLITAILKNERKKENAKQKSEKEEETPHQLMRRRWIHEGDEPMDLLNVQDVTSRVYSRKDERIVEDDEVKYNELGKIVVEEEKEPRKKRIGNFEGEEEEEKNEKEGRKLPRLNRRMKDRSGDQDGSRFRSTKAKGDMSKGGMQPYAYIQLDSSLLSKKKKNQALSKFSNLIGAAKRGANEGATKKRRRN